MWKIALIFSAIRQQKLEHWRRTAFFVLCLFILGLLFRLPQLINPAVLNSDMAIVSVQARHILKGEFSLFLWGTDYQSSFDALVLAPLFFLFGATPAVAMVGPLIGFVAILGFTFGVLRRHISELQAAACCLLLVVTPRTVTQYICYAPRIWSIVAVFFAVWLFDRASREKRSEIFLACGGFVSIVATFLDLYTLQWVPAVVVFGLLCCADIRDGWRKILRRVGAEGIGIVMGVGLVSILRGKRENASVTKLNFSRLEHNWNLFVDQCWPSLFDYKGTVRPEGVDIDIYQAAVLGRAFQNFGVLLAVGLLLMGGLALFLKKLPWGLRRTAAFGAGSALCSVGGFMVSESVVDIFSSRYLTPVIWVLPFASAVTVSLLKKNSRFIALLSPYLVSIAFSAWSSISEVDGWKPRIHAYGRGENERVLRDWLRDKQIRYAMAPYWESYRLAFLFGERPQVIPFDIGQDRHKETRDDFFREKRVAYIFRADGPSDAERSEIRSRHEASSRFRNYSVSGFNVLVLEH
jgi:hypothetical protein